MSVLFFTFNSKGIDFCMNFCFWIKTRYHFKLSYPKNKEFLPQVKQYPSQNSTKTQRKLQDERWKYENK